jgi:hypothetical protein
MDIIPRNNQSLELISVCRVDQQIIYTRDNQQLVLHISISWDRIKNIDIKVPIILSLYVN